MYNIYVLKIIVFDFFSSKIIHSSFYTPIRQYIINKELIYDKNLYLIFYIKKY